MELDWLIFHQPIFTSKKLLRNIKKFVTLQYFEFDNHPTMDQSNKNIDQIWKHNMCEDERKFTHTKLILKQPSQDCIVPFLLQSAELT